MIVPSFRPVKRGLIALLAVGAAAAGMTAMPSPARADAPSNDDFVHATDISGTSVTVTNGSSIGASVEADEPTAMGYGWTLGASVWYRWTAPSTAGYAVSTAGSDFDTELNVYTGSAVNALTRVATDDEVFEGASDGTSATGFPATAGTTYMIQVGGYVGNGTTAAGTVHLTVSQAAISGTITYESNATPTNDPLSGCINFYTAPNDPSTFVGGGCGSGMHGSKATYVIGVVAPGTYYVGAASNGYRYDFLGPDAAHAVQITIPGGGCTLTGFDVDLNNGDYTLPTAESCPLAPACMGAKDAVSQATAALAARRAALAADAHGAAVLKQQLQKATKKAKKHHKPVKKATKKLSQQLEAAQLRSKTAMTAVAAATRMLSAARAKVASSCEMTLPSTSGHTGGVL